MIIRRLARPLLAAIFISGGLNALRKPEPHAQAADAMLSKSGFGISQEQLPADLGTLVQIDGAVKVGAGLLLALGRVPRLSALLLAASLVPTTLAGHRFWEYEDEAQRAGQLVHFQKNLALLGGLMLVSVDTGGKPSLGWRARRSAKKLRRQAKHAVTTAKLATDLS